MFQLYSDFASLFVLFAWLAFVSRVKRIKLLLLFHGPLVSATEKRVHYVT